MFRAGDVIAYVDMCTEEGVNLQRGMGRRLLGAVLSSRGLPPWELWRERAPPLLALDRGASAVR